MDQIIDERWLFISDVDGTLLGDDIALAQLTQALQPQRERITLAFNSSRTCASLRESLATNNALPRPDYLIGAVGTEIEDLRLDRRLDDYSANLALGWPRDQLAALMIEMGFEPHEGQHQTPLKASFNVPGEANYRRVLDQLAQRGLSARVIYSEDKNLDLLPLGVDKGKAADYLRMHLGFEMRQVVIAGDGGNDLAVFERGFKSIVVANAEASLKALGGPNVYHAHAEYAAGVLEGLRRWHVLSD